MTKLGIWGMFVLAVALLAMWAFAGFPTMIVGFMAAGVALAVAANCAEPSPLSVGKKFKRRPARERVCFLAVIICFALYDTMTGACMGCASENSDGEKVIFLRALPLYLIMSGLPLAAAFIGARGFYFRDDPLRFVRVAGVFASFVFAVLTAGSVLAVWLLSPVGVVAQYDGVLTGVGFFCATLFACFGALKRG